MRARLERDIRGRPASRFAGLFEGNDFSVLFARVKVVTPANDHITFSRHSIELILSAPFGSVTIARATTRCHFFCIAVGTKAG